MAAILAEMAANGGWGKYDGPYSERLVVALQEKFKQRFAWLCSSGTVAVELALRGLAIQSDDEVLLAGYDFAGNFRAIEAVGARPVLVDIEPHSWCISVDEVKAAAGPATRCVLFSHLHGGLTRMTELRRWADERGIALLEDACQAPGATVDGRPTGSWGDVSVLSFGGSKLLSAGRGGAVLTSRPEVLQRIKIFVERGNNAFPLSELQAAVLGPQLEHLDAANELRRAAVRRLRALTSDLPSLTPLADVDSSGDSRAVYYKFPWLWTHESVSREKFLAAAQRCGLPVDAGFRGFAGRSTRRCRKHGELPHSLRAAMSTVLLHHPVLLAEPSWIEVLGDVLREVVVEVV